MKIVHCLLAASLLVVSAPAQRPSPMRDIEIRDLRESNLRIATFNVSLNRFSAGALIGDLSTPFDSQAQAVAEIIQRNRPDVVLLNEVDFDAAGDAVRLFQQNYLARSQNGATPIVYRHVLLAPSNTGVDSGFDLDNDGMTGGPGDAQGFGFFEGQFGMVLLSRFPIDRANVRTFQNFLWKDMPGALLPDDPNTATPDDWYTQAELDVLRLSSKSHWDIPVQVQGGRTIHLLCAHPTPPVFDGPEDRNGRRNHDEIRFWADYVTPGAAGYIYDDAGTTGGIASGASFVIVGDYNADPNDGDSFPGAAQQLLGHAAINDAFTPRSGGGAEAAETQGQNNAMHAGSALEDTADFFDGGPGNLRVDYVLPSADLNVIASGVFWPTSDQDLFRLTGPGFPPVSSDHRLVWIDVRPARGRVTFLGEETFPSGFQFQGTTVGGLSGLTYAPEFGLYAAISDDRSNVNPARFYALSIDLSDGTLDAGDVTFVGTLPLLSRMGTTYAPNTIDPEGIVYNSNGFFLISSEGDTNQGIDPFIDGFTIPGQNVGPLPVPSKYLVGTAGTGVRNNLAFESLTASPLETALFTATENALQQDGPTASTASGSASRILTYTLAAGGPDAEYVYMTDPIAFPANPAGSFATSGLVELLAVRGEGDRTDTAFLALERSFSVGVGNDCKVYLVDLRGADDVSSLESLAGQLQIVRPVRKELLFDVRAFGIDPDNLEALAFGPTLPDGRRTLIIVSDDNFNPNGQRTQFLAFALPRGL